MKSSPGAAARRDKAREHQAIDTHQARALSGFTHVVHLARRIAPGGTSRRRGERTQSRGGEARGPQATEFPLDVYESYALLLFLPGLLHFLLADPR